MHPLDRLPFGGTLPTLTLTPRPLCEPRAQPDLEPVLSFPILPGVSLLLDLHIMMYFQLRVIVGKLGGSGGMSWVPGVPRVALFWGGEKILPRKDLTYPTMHPKVQLPPLSFQSACQPCCANPPGQEALKRVCVMRIGDLEPSMEVRTPTGCLLCTWPAV